MPTKNPLSRILSSSTKGGPEDQMVDVLRVLVMNLGALWRSELVQELSSLRVFRKEPSVNEVELDEALERLRSEGLITVEARLKASLNDDQGVQDKLVSIVDIRSTSRALVKDKVMKSYDRWIKSLGR